MITHYGFLSKLASKNPALDKLSIYSAGLSGAPVSDFNLYFIPSSCFKEITASHLVYKALQMYSQPLFAHHKSKILTEAIEKVELQLVDYLGCKESLPYIDSPVDYSYKKLTSVPEDFVAGIFHVLMDVDVMDGFIKVNCDVLQFKPYVMGRGGAVVFIESIPSR